MRHVCHEIKVFLFWVRRFFFLVVIMKIYCYVLRLQVSLSHYFHFLSLFFFYLAVRKLLKKKIGIRTKLQ